MSEHHDSGRPAHHDGAWQESPQLIVGLGASAGGISALREFFAHVSPDSGSAYVVILHLSPDHESKLAEVLQQTSAIPVVTVHDAVRIRPNHVYVISPNSSLGIIDGILLPTPIGDLDERRSPIDLFFRALGEADSTRAVAVILSGTGSDGSSGFKRIKEQGGLAIAQDPATAEFPDMPSAAAATGLVDLVLKPADMPAQIRDYGTRLGRAVLDVPMVADEADVAPLRAVLVALRARVGQDFSTYKSATILRRISRRMSVMKVATLPEYARFVREDEREAAALMKDLLISVTNFFRDAEAFRVLETRVIPRLFSGSATEQVRVWCAGCATGEEAYSLAMLLAEADPGHLDPPSIQVFATDLDESAIAVARAGFYTDVEVADVSTARLKRFFHRTTGGYRVARDLREMVLFAHHNVVKDPPFSHLDLISCRNLLIYLNRPVQERVLETFHFALRPGRYLFLGQAESPSGTEVFAPVDKSAHVFESRNSGARVPLPPAESTTATVRAPLHGVPFTTGERLPPSELHLRLVEQYAPPSLVVTDDYRLVHVTAGASRYLAISAGEPSHDVIQLVRPELRADLRAALHQATLERTNIDVRRVSVPLDGVERLVRLQVRPALTDGDPLRGYFLVLFEEEREDAAHPAQEAVELDSPVAAATAHLDEELARVKSQLRGAIEQYGTQVEEAKAANEELQALNEELRSSAEELETSKEELQSVNEELTTVNQELKIKIDELAHINNDFVNFINSTDIPSIFLDRQLRVKLTTPRATDVFNLVPADRGRPLSDITNRLAYLRLHDDVREVLQHLQVLEREVETVEGKWYLMRLLPYRTTDDRIDGVVITFLDITTRHQAEDRVRMEEERLRLLIDTALDYAIFTMTAEGVIDSWNPGAQRMFGYDAADIVGTSAAVLFTPEDRATGVPEAELNTAVRIGRAEDERWHVRRDGSRLYCSGVTTRLGNAQRFGFAKIARDLTERREQELAVTRAYGQLEDRVRDRTSELQTRVAQHAAAEERVTSLLRKVVTAQEDERARIARDLHDHLGQRLTALRLALERHSAACNAAGDEVGKALALASEIDKEADFLAWELRPAALDDLGLAVALPRFVQQWSTHYGIAAEYRTASFTAGDLRPDDEVMFYRVAQEALNNVIKHAHASRVDVLLETRDRTVKLVVDDDGIGFDLADRALMEAGIGLAGMRERAALIGGTLDIESSPGHGTSVFLRRRVES